MTARMAKKKTFAGTSMGIPSIIAILVLMVLVVFSALSIMTARADLTLSRKASDSLKAYYDADCRAEEIMAEADAAIRGGSSGWQDALREDGLDVTETDGGQTAVSYVVAIDENRNLNVVLFLSADGALTRHVWQVTPSGEWDAEENLKLYIPK
jgi:hypothetical protein